ncbi:hypothetical protein JTB14_013277 [Gonioctena quinquepunctata]|nr:hypothetical protein JTB14_013277 [Gonioctena quinquepunctata]
MEKSKSTKKGEKPLKFTASDPTESKKDTNLFEEYERYDEDLPLITLINETSERKLEEAEEKKKVIANVAKRSRK